MKACYLVSTHGYFDVDPVTGSVATAGRPDTGGQTVYTVELAKALGRIGIPTFLVTRWFDIAKPELQQLGPNAWLLRLRGGDWGFIRKERIYNVLPEISDRLISFIEQDWPEMFAEARLDPPATVQPAFFHGHYVDGGIVALEAARQFHTPLFWTSHSLGALKRERMGGEEKEMEKIFSFNHRIREEKRVMKRALANGGFTVTAKTEQDDILRLYGVDAAAAQFIPPGVDISKFRSLQKEEEDPVIPGWPAHGPVVLMGGRMARTKGYELALEAFHQALHEVPNANIVIFGGSDNPSDEERSVLKLLDDYRERYGIARKVFFLGARPQDQLPPLFRKADLFLMPSRHEPFGMVALEAAATGTPVIVSSHAGLAGELKDRRDCLIVTPEDTSAFSRAIVDLLNSPARARQIGKTGQDTINGHYSWEGIAQRHLDFWRSRDVQI